MVVVEWSSEEEGAVVCRCDRKDGLVRVGFGCEGVFTILQAVKAWYRSSSYSKIGAVATERVP